MRDSIGQGEAGRFSLSLLSARLGAWVLSCPSIGPERPRVAEDAILFHAPNDGGSQLNPWPATSVGRQAQRRLRLRGIRRSS